MRAIEIQQFGIDYLARVEQPRPEPGPTEVLVELHAASLNYRDVMVASGTYNPRMRLPAVPLSDGAGEIVAVGDAVSKWRVGARVMPIFVQRWFDGGPTDESRRTALGAGQQWDGVLREFAVFDQESVVAILEHLDYEQAATLPCAALTAWNALVVSGGCKTGDTVLTLGTGGVSIFAVQIAKMVGAKVISTSGSVKKIQKLKELGADETINYRSNEDWHKTVLELTDGIGVDHVVEVGGAGTLDKSIAATRIGGHIALIGALAAPGNFNAVPVFMKALRLQGIFVGSRAMFLDLLAAVANAKLEPIIDRVFAFDEIRDALRYMESGSHFGKIVIRY